MTLGTIIGLCSTVATNAAAKAATAVVSGGMEIGTLIGLIGAITGLMTVLLKFGKFYYDHFKTESSFDTLRVKCG